MWPMRSGATVSDTPAVERRPIVKIKEIMTTDVQTVRSATPLKEAAAVLAEHRISGLPVVDAEGYVVGVISEGDILFKESGKTEKRSLFERLVAAPASGIDVKLAATTAGEAMSAPALTIGPRRSVSEAATVMIDEGVNRLPVVDDDGKLIGIVTRADLVRAFVRSDEDVAREIREDVIRRTLWIEPNTIEVTVEDGEVRLSGEVETKGDAELIPSFVQRVPGVVSVLSKLRWPEAAAS
jgi:CBS domain-containing protein